jgi:hypothetical protein
VPRRRDRLLVDESPRRDVITTEGGVHAFVVVVAVNARPAMPAMGTPAMRNGFMLCTNMYYSVFGGFSWSRFRHNVRRPGQFVCPNSDSVRPNSDKIYLTMMTFKFLLLFFAY